MQKKVILFSLVVVGLFAAGAITPLIGRVSLPKVAQTKAETTCLCPETSLPGTEFVSTLETASPAASVEASEASKAAKKVIKVTPVPSPDLMGEVK